MGTIPLPDAAYPSYNGRFGMAHSRVLPGDGFICYSTSGGLRNAQAKNPQGNKETVSANGQRESKASPIRNEPFGGPHGPEKKTELARNHNRGYGDGKVNSRSIGWQQLLK
jgi:hypothetical protein